MTWPAFGQIVKRAVMAVVAVWLLAMVAWPEKHYLIVYSGSFTYAAGGEKRGVGYIRALPPAQGVALLAGPMATRNGDRFEEIVRTRWERESALPTILGRYAPRRDGWLPGLTTRGWGAQPRSE